MTLAYIRNKVVAVEPMEEGNLLITWRLVDSLTEAEIRMKVRLPDLEITEARSRLERSPHPECAAALDSVQKVVGVRVGPGLRKIVHGLMRGSAGCAELIEGILECANAAILHFTVPQVEANAKGSEEERRKRYQDMLRFNPRLARSCIAFADDSPLLEGMNVK
jgi:hypothetical protein